MMTKLSPPQHAYLCILLRGNRAVCRMMQITTIKIIKIYSVSLFFLRVTVSDLETDSKKRMRGCIVKVNLSITLCVCFLMYRLKECFQTVKKKKKSVLSLDSFLIKKKYYFWSRILISHIWLMVYVWKYATFY